MQSAEERAKATRLLASRHAGRWHLDGGSGMDMEYSPVIQSALMIPFPNCRETRSTNENENLF